MAKKSFSFTTILFGLVALAGGIFISQMAIKPAPTGYPGLGGDFTLNSINGPVTLKQFKGKVTVIYFGYTYCPDVCPTALTTMTQAIKKFNDAEQAQIQPLFISVDPERDTVERLAEYTKHFHPSMMGLNGDLPTTHIVAKNYTVFFAKANMGDSAVNYAMDHSSKIFIIDREGVIQSFISSSEPAEDVYKAIKSTLDQPYH